MSDLDKALAAALQANDEWAAMLAGGRLALARLAGGDLPGLAALLRHASPAVSHGAAEALAQESPAIEPAVAPLANALLDNTGAVLFHGLRALMRAASAGVDMEPARDVLERLLQIEAYAISGFTHGLDPSEQSDLRAQRPNRDAAQTLAYHYLARGEIDALRELLEGDAPTLVHGALKAVRTEEHHADAGRREQAATLLVPAYTKMSAWEGIQALLRARDQATARGARTGLRHALGGPLDDDARARLEALAQRAS